MPLYESIAKLPITEHAAEIDRRCKAEYEKRLQSKLPMTPAHIQMICGIGKATYDEWTRGNSTVRVNGGFAHPLPEDNNRRSDEVKAAEIERRETLHIWESVCAAMLADTATYSESKSAVTGANFMLERSLGYQRDVATDAANSGMGLEALLSRLELRLATQSKPAELKADVALISIPPETAGDTE